MIPYPDTESASRQESRNTFWDPSKSDEGDLPERKHSHIQLHSKE
jgi:hypothetical protein